MKKAVFIISLFVTALFLHACNQPVQECDTHELQYVIYGSFHWQECAREGCDYKTEKAEHMGGTATCVSRAICTDCGALYGGIGDHDLLRTSCTEPAKCKNCDFSDGKVSHHVQYSWVEDVETCSSFLTCVDCGHQIESRKHHTVASDGVTCAHCGVNIFDDTVKFQLSDDGNSYILTSAVSYTARTMEIPAEYKGLPVTEIGDAAFSWNEYLEEVILPDTIKVIGTLSFESTRIKSIIIPDSIEVMGNGAFLCSDLESIVFGTGIREIGADAFSATKLKSIAFPGSVEIVASTAFSGCEHLELVTIADGVKYIEAFAFSACPNLKSLTLPNTLESVHCNALQNTPSLEYNIHQGLKYLGNATNPYLALAGYAGATNAVIHPDTKICIQHALLNCEKITSLEIGASVSIIEELALSGMDALESITVVPENPYYYAVNNLLVDNRINEPVLGCKTSVIPDDGRFEKINLSIFSENTSIQIIYIPKGVKTLYVGFSLKNLQYIIIEADVEHLTIDGNNDGCRSKKDVCYAVYYCHTEEEWQHVTIEYTFDRDAPVRVVDCYGDYATHYFYSETQPTTEGNYWHYVDGVPTPW